ncbi:MAG: rRNA pseudouridine synthase [Oscillospiraceae bacterium]|nr:rRNA pseudouridine synthase [Oscillospiraceae bacterium]
MEERLQKILSAAGACSRRRAEDWIRAGRVLVNGQPAVLGQRADPDRDMITLDGQPIGTGDGPPVYYLLHKPRGYVTTLSDEQGRASVADLIEDIPCRVWPVGRLDRDSEGLLLLTNDGALTHRLLHPAFRVEKQYHVWVTGPVERGLSILRGPITLDGQLLAPVEVEALPGAEERRACLDFLLRQGKKRQIRRMCAAAGLKVERLVRVREGSLRLEGLEPGKYRPLTDVEIQSLSSRREQGTNPERR